MLGKVLVGVYAPHEEEANRLLIASRQGVTNHSEKQDWLSTEQEAMRRGREVYNENGFPDKSIRSGYYRRAYNPMIGKRPTKSSTFPEEGSKTLYEW